MTLRSLLFLFFGCAAVARAYPPAPGDTLFGTVREERGRVWAKGAAWVIVSNDAGEIVRTPIDLALVAAGAVGCGVVWCWCDCEC